MDELLKKLLAAEVLTEDTRVELEAAFKTQLKEAIATARAEAQAAVTTELNAQWIKDREILIEALDAKVTEALAEEIKELRTDIERFRDLEAEYAQKIVEAKQALSATMKKDISQLIEKLNTFLEIRLTAELEELREDVATVKKNEFGRKVFESFIDEFKKHYAGDDSIESKLTETEQQLTDTMAALVEAEKKANKLERIIKTEKVLAPLSGRAREVMEAILKSVEVSALEEAYKTYIGRVLKETTDVEVPAKTSGKEDKVLAEGVKKQEIKGVVKTGNDTAQLVEDAQDARRDVIPVTGLSEADKRNLQQLAGVFA